MEMVQQRKQGLGGNSQRPSTSRSFTMAEFGAMNDGNNARVITLVLICRGQQWVCKRSDRLW